MTSVNRVKIPATALSSEALLSIIEAFVLREGTDYGPAEFSLSAKVAAVRRALDAGTAFIDFDPLTESVNILPADASADGD